MSLYFIKCLMFTTNKIIKIKCEIDLKISLDSPCIDSGSEMLKIIDEEELSYY